jgi:exopolyphosphatase/guanosine-5'-triphosphate,3'-diphosphate pyrophosphatase
VAGSRRVGAIDIGTNTVLLLVAEGSPRSPSAVLERATITRLGKGVDQTRRLSSEGIARTVACLATYADLLRELGVERTLAVCTSAARDAENGAEFLETARQALGTTPRIVDGNEEARLVFDGALTGLSLDGPVTVFDIGGGSTEVIRGICSGDRAVPERAVSMNIGSVRLTERHVHDDPPNAGELRAIADDIDEHLSTAPLDDPGTLVGVAGTMTTLAAVEKELDTYDPAVVHGSVLRKSAIQSMFDRLSQVPLDLRRQVPGLEPARADVILAGALIALRLMERARADEVLVSDRGVRWGLAKAALNPANPRGQDP